MANIELAEKYLPYVDEEFSTESKISLLTNQDFNFNGANTVDVYIVSTGAMNDYGRHKTGENTQYVSRYGNIEDLNATTQSFQLTKDRSFTFVIDKLDEDETAGNLQAASALARQIRQVVIPEVDTHVLGKICEKAGNKEILAADYDIYQKIFEANKLLDDAEAPETDRVIVVTPETLFRMKTAKDANGRYQEIVNTVIDSKLKALGVVGELDGSYVLKVPTGRLPKNFGFAVVHPCATCAPQKLQSYKVHEDPPGISGALVEGRICYDAFVLQNKAKAIAVYSTAEG